MSKFTDFLNLFKWNIVDDSEEEFDIDKALNENWDKIDKKIQQHVNSTSFIHSNATQNKEGFMSKEDKQKIDNIQEKAQVNIIEKIKKNGTEIEITNKEVNIELKKDDVGLNKVDNTSDLDKPISNLQKKEFDKKVDKENGKGLSSNDFTNELKEKLENIDNSINDKNNSLKLDIINMFQNFVFSDNGSGVLRYNLQGLYKTNLTKVELAYTTSSSLTIEPEYTELDNYNYIIETGITNQTIYIWIKLTYSDLGEIVITSNNSDERYSVYMESGGLACFTSDTLILTNDGLKEIKSLKINDEIMTTNGLQKITKMYSHIANKIYKIYAEDTIIKASWSHPFITKNRGEVLAKDLTNKDKLYNINGEIVYINKVEVEEKQEVVYEINTDVNNYYITDKNILVASENLGGV